MYENVPAFSVKPRPATDLGGDGVLLRAMIAGAKTDPGGNWPAARSARGLPEHRRKARRGGFAAPEFSGLLVGLGPRDSAFLRKIAGVSFSLALEKALQAACEVNAVSRHLSGLERAKAGIFERDDFANESAQHHRLPCVAQLPASRREWPGCDGPPAQDSAAPVHLPKRS